MHCHRLITWLISSLYLVYATSLHYDGIPIVLGVHMHLVWFLDSSKGNPIGIVNKFANNKY